MKIIIAGGSGYLGEVLLQFFKDENLVVLTRNDNKIINNVEYVKWDGKTVEKNWLDKLEGSSVLINLAGKSVDCRYNEANRTEIIESRVLSTLVLQNALETLTNPPKIWLNCSSATIYEHASKACHTEEDYILGTGFSVDVCKRWEEAFFKHNLPSTRKVCLRISIVFGKNAKVFQILNRLVKFRLGGRQGSGKQYVSWIHEADFARAIKYIIDNENINGVVNFASPTSLVNTSMMQKLRKKNKVKFGFISPAFLIKFGAIFLRTEAELVLKSRNVFPKKLLDNNFIFKYNTFDDALNEIVD